MAPFRFFDMLPTTACKQGHSWDAHGIRRTIRKGTRLVQRWYCVTCKNLRQRNSIKKRAKPSSGWLNYGEPENTPVDGMLPLKVTPRVLRQYYDERAGAMVTVYAAPWESL